MNALHTDLYQLTMAAGYYQAGKTGEIATFELFVRRLPTNRNFLVAAGLAQAVDYLLNFRFTAGEIDYLRGLPQFSRTPAEFFESLAALRFTGDLWAVPEGTPIFANEPLLRVRAPLMEAQVPETYLLATIGFQTMIATKAARCAATAVPRTVVEFGTRRAHSPAAGALAGRASYIGGCIGTSNVESGFRYGIPVFGTAAHSWVQSFEDEVEAFRRLKDLLGPSTVYLIDTYDTLEGARKAAAMGRPMWGVRLDSGNLVVLSRQVRQILDEAGMRDARIMATGDLNEYKIVELCAAGVPIDSFGVGTELATSADAPHLGAIYKLVEMETGGATRYTAKFSSDKLTMPGAKQVYRNGGGDEITLAGEAPATPGARPLLEPVIRGGELVSRLPDARAARDTCADHLSQLPPALQSLYEAKTPYPVEYSPGLLGILESLRRDRRKGA